MKIVVMVPAFNEEETISTVIRRIPRTIGEGANVVVVVIDDGSSDSTAKLAHQSGADVVYRHRENAGIAHTFKTGMRCALKMGAQIIVNIDADNQFDPQEIPRLVLPIIDGRADVVLGSRFLNESYGLMPVAKKSGNIIIGWLVSILSGRRIRDTQCGFRALSSRAAKTVRLSGLFTYTQEMILDLSYKRMRIVEVPISVRYFRGRKSRVVKNIPLYSAKVVGLILNTTLQRFLGIILAIVSLTGLFAVLAFLLTR